MNVTIQPQKVKVLINQNNMGINVSSPIAREILDTYPYEGEYIVDPTTETQTLLTKNLRMINNLVINPIPNNYGLVTWNGSFLVIS